MGWQEQTPVAPIQQEEKNPSVWCKSPNVYVSTIKNRTLCEGTSRTSNTRVRLWEDYTDSQKLAVLHPCTISGHILPLSGPTDEWASQKDTTKSWVSWWVHPSRCIASDRPLPESRQIPKGWEERFQSTCPGTSSQTAPWTDGEHNILSGRKRVPSPGAFVMFADQSLATAYKYSGVMDLRFS